MRDLVILGAGGYGTEALEVAEAMNEDTSRWNILGILDDDHRKHGALICDHPVLGGRDWLDGRDLDVVVCLGQPSLRRLVCLDVAARCRVAFPSLIHPAATISKRAQIGPGTVVFAGSVVATNTRIGNHVLVGRNASVGHDLSVEDYVNIFPAATLSGHSSIGEGTEIGSNATVIPMMQVGCWSVIGAGAVVTRDFPDNITAVGMPANIVKQREIGWHNKN